MEHQTPQHTNTPTGLLLGDKPHGWTSMDAIRRVRRVTGVNKVGHAGTLDPYATGLLLICIGREATRHIDSLMSLPKTYIATIDLSAFSSTDDAEGILTPVKVTTAPPQKAVVNYLKRHFEGTIYQRPPAYSAVKVDGKRAYSHARAGEPLELPRRRVTIHEINVIEHSWPFIRIQVTCGKGTYIRSIARELGEMISTGGYLTDLKRVECGPFSVEEAYDLETLAKVTPDMLLPPHGYETTQQ